MLPSCEVTGEIILVFAFAAAYVALERVLVPVAAHVDGVEDVVGEVHVAVLAVVQELRVLGRQGRRGRARLAVSYARGARVGTGFAAGTGHGTVVPLALGRPGLGAGGGGALRNARGHGGNHGLGGGLLHQERLLVRAGHDVRGRGVLAFGGQAGQLPCERGELVQRVVDQEFLGVPG